MFPRKLIALSLVAVLALFAVTNQHIGSGRAQEDSSSPSAPLGTSISYQGVLTNSNDNPINGSCDFKFSLYDADIAGTLVGTTQEKTAVPLTKGTFTVVLDFGSGSFTGDARWLEVAVRCPASSGSYTTLSPRQALTAAPYASYAPAAGNANLLDGQNASAFASATHNHYGETWVGDGIGLTVFNNSLDDWSAAIKGASTAKGVTTTIGVLGDSWTELGVGVLGHAGATTGSGKGGYFLSDATGGYGVFAYTSANTGINYGVYGQSNSPDGYGVYGLASATSGVNRGVYGTSDSTDGRGVVGWAMASSGVNYGVIGGTYSTDGTGVWGKAVATNGTTYGVFGENNSTIGYGVYGHSYATSGTNYGVYGATNSPNGYGVYGNATDPDSNYGVFSYGNLGYTGLAGHVSLTKNYGWLNLYGVESSEVVGEDVGSAQLVEGAAVVTIDPKFAETVNLNVPYQVFVTPLGDCGLYVTDKIATSFTVRAQGGAKCSLDFDYRIIAKRLGYEDTRMAPAADPNLVLQNIKLPEEPAPLPQVPQP